MWLLALFLNDVGVRWSGLFLNFLVLPEKAPGAKDLAPEHCNCGFNHSLVNAGGRIMILLLKKRVF